MDNSLNHRVNAPKTLQEWRSQELELHLAGAYPRSVWTPLESFFLSHGYTLWLPPTSLYQRPPNDAPRAPDGFTYILRNRTDTTEI